MADMSLLTAEKLSQTKEMYSPQITEFLDITDNATFKVCVTIGRLYRNNYVVATCTCTCTCIIL